MHRSSRALNRGNEQISYVVRYDAARFQLIILLPRPWQGR